MGPKSNFLCSRQTDFSPVFAFSLITTPYTLFMMKVSVSSWTPHPILDLQSTSLIWPPLTKSCAIFLVQIPIRSSLSWTFARIAFKFVFNGFKLLKHLSGVSTNFVHYYSCCFTSANARYIYLYYTVLEGRQYQKFLSQNCTNTKL